MDHAQEGALVDEVKAVRINQRGAFRVVHDPAEGVHKT